MDYLDYEETIQKLFDMDITSYQIAKDLGITTQFVDNYRLGKRKLSSMQLGRARELVDYYLKTKERETL